jgi:hypothetical protein
MHRMATPTEPYVPLAIMPCTYHLWRVEKPKPRQQGEMFSSSPKTTEKAAAAVPHSTLNDSLNQMGPQTGRLTPYARQ